MMKKIIIACLLALLFTGGISYSWDSTIVRESSVSGEAGTVLAEIPINDLVIGECTGTDSIVLTPDGQFVLCWGVGDIRYGSPPLSIADEGDHYLKVYLIYNDPEEISSPTNEVKVTIRKKLPTPTGCSVRRFIP